MQTMASASSVYKNQFIRHFFKQFAVLERCFDTLSISAVLERNSNAHAKRQNNRRRIRLRDQDGKFGVVRARKRRSVSNIRLLATARFAYNACRALFDIEEFCLVCGSNGRSNRLRDYCKEKIECVHFCAASRSLTCFESWPPRIKPIICRHKQLILASTT